MVFSFHIRKYILWNCTGIVLLVQKGKLGLLFVIVRLVSILVLMMSPGTGPTMHYQVLYFLLLFTNTYFLLDFSTSETNEMKSNTQYRKDQVKSILMIFTLQLPLSRRLSPSITTFPSFSLHPDLNLGSSYSSTGNSVGAWNRDTRLKVLFVIIMGISL